MTVRQLLLTTIGAAIALVCVLLVAQRTSSDSDSDALAALSTPSVATTVLSVLPTLETEPTPQPVLASTSVSTLLTRFLTTEAGPSDRPADWSGHIRKVTVGLQTATISTDLGDTPEDRRVADEIASVAVRFAESSSGRNVAAPDVAVLGANQQSLATRDAIRVARGPAPR